MRARALLPSLIVAAGGCTLPEPPGELVGEYAVDGTLMLNSCGTEAVPAVDPLRFQVQLRDDEGVGLWLMAPPPRSGMLTTDGAFEFELERFYPVDPDPNQRVSPELLTTDPEAYVDEVSLDRFDPAAANAGPGCTLRVVERIEGVLNRRLVDVQDMETAALGDPDADLVADNRIEVRAASGSNCSFVMQEAGGPFEELPCELRYTLEGELLDTPDP